MPAVKRTLAQVCHSHMTSAGMIFFWKLTVTCCDTPAISSRSLSHTQHAVWKQIKADQQDTMKRVLRSGKHCHSRSAVTADRWTLSIHSAETLPRQLRSVIKNNPNLPSTHLTYAKYDNMANHKYTGIVVHTGLRFKISMQQNWITVSSSEFKRLRLFLKKTPAYSRGCNLFTHSLGQQRGLCQRD